MAGAIIENMSGRKLAMIGSVLILCQMICFLVGAIFSPAPNNSDQFLATKVIEVIFGKVVEQLGTISLTGIVHFISFSFTKCIFIYSINMTY